MNPRSLILLLILAGVACQRAPAGGGAAPPAGDPWAEARALIDAGQLDAALAKIPGDSRDPEALFLLGKVWARKAATAPLPTPPPPSSVLPRGVAPPAAPEFKPEELRALEFFERAVAAKPNHPGAHLGLAELLAPHAHARFEREREAAAQAASRRGRKGRGPEHIPPAPEGPDASVERVVREYRLAAQGDPRAKGPVEALIQFAESVGRLEDANLAFQELLRRDKEKAEPFVRYGDFLLHQKKDGMGAIGEYAQALMWRPDDDATRAKIADIYLAMSAEHLGQREYASAEARLKDAQRYITDKNSPQGLKIQEQLSQLAQIRGRPPSR
jgi:tetratricopeptide (TPR) repeat protein